MFPFLGASSYLESDLALHLPSSSPRKLRGARAGSIEVRPIRPCPSLLESLGKARDTTLLRDVLFAGSVLLTASLAAGQPTFERDILPLFQASCTSCHGPDIQESRLRLDSEDEVRRGGLSGPAVIPKSAEESPLLRRILALDEPSMPFGADPLSADAIALVREWVESLDVAPVDTPPASKHWAYGKPRRPALPEVNAAAWVRNPIDRFVLARLEKEGLAPSPEARKETSIRRLSLDLVGLPPTLEEVDAFLADERPDAYERLVERLLASNHYGERWARPWLDLARYADTNGYEKDNARTMWKYRDWVIDALNRDLSFREFTIEQIAGDMLPGATAAQRIATGFHRNTLLNQEGGVDDEEARFETLLDRVNTTATAWLGTTLACAQCHNHKFDPFTQKEYYQLLAFFDHSEYEILKIGQGESWVVEPELPLPTPEQDARSREILAETTELRSLLDASTPEIEEDQAVWEAAMRGAEADWTVLFPTRQESLGGATLTLLDDRSLLSGGKNPDADTYLLRASCPIPEIRAVRLEVLEHPSLPGGGPGRDDEGNFFLSAFEVEAGSVRVHFQEAVADEWQAGYEIKKVLSEAPDDGGWAIDKSPSQRTLVRQAVFVSVSPVSCASARDLTVRLKHEMPRAARSIGRFRISVTGRDDATRIALLPARLRPTLELPPTDRTVEEKTALARVHRSLTPILEPVRSRMAQLEEELESLGIVSALVMSERKDHERPSTPLRARGSFMSPGERVYAEVPAALPPLGSDQMPNRLGLARWLVSDENPLTARVLVNRLWEELFGRGLVETSEDFGIQGSPPSHPELLDFLAVELMENGWSLKSILRTLVTSATYRQSSVVTKEIWERDSYNRFLARGPRFRVDSETVRDIHLAASGLLSRRVGGPSAFPYQLDGIWNRPYSDERWLMSDAPDRYRRGIYTYVRRTSPYPSLVTFDAPSREVCTARRVRTNTPLQALTTLNDPAFFEAAQHLAKRMVTEAGPESPARAAHGFRLCVSRRPSREELAEVLAYQEKERFRFAADLEAALAVVEEQWEPGIDLADLAAWTMVANVLLNLDETVTKE
jgi:Protein of unknown function (DUF1553)/Protein of unknown function (DUF1549)/Planctomycete cytochrome C